MPDNAPLRYLKTDQYWKSCVLKIDDNILPFNTYSALKAYLNIRPKFDGPLFCHLNRSVLTRTQFLSALQSSLQFLGYNTHRINTHSFRIGAATYYAMLGLNEDETKLKKRANGAPTHTNVILDYNSVLIYFRFTNRLDCWKLLDAKSG